MVFLLLTSFFCFEDLFNGQLPGLKPEPLHLRQIAFLRAVLKSRRLRARELPDSPICEVCHPAAVQNGCHAVQCVSAIVEM